MIAYVFLFISLTTGSQVAGPYKTQSDCRAGLSAARVQVQQVLDSGNAPVGDMYGLSDDCIKITLKEVKARA